MINHCNREKTNLDCSFWNTCENANEKTDIWLQTQKIINPETHPRKTEPRLSRSTNINHQYTSAIANNGPDHTHRSHSAPRTFNRSTPAETLTASTTEKIDNLIIKNTFDQINHLFSELCKYTESFPLCYCTNENYFNYNGKNPVAWTRPPALLLHPSLIAT